MEYNRFSQRLTVVVTMIVGLVAAVALGKMAAQGQTGPILMCGIGALGLALLLGLKERIWMLLVMAWPMTGQIRALNIPFGVRDIIVFYVLVGYIALIAFKIVRKRNLVTSIDITMFVVLLMLAVAFIRNPVGFDAIGSERVGGRPYFNVLMALLTWWVLSRADLGSISPKKLFALILFGRCLDGILAAVLFLVPGSENFFADFYSTPTMTSGINDESTVSPLTENSGRLMFLGFLGLPILSAMFAYDRPLGWMSVIRPWKPLFLIFVFTMLMKSGFRSAFAIVIGVGLFSGYIRQGYRDVLKMAAVGSLLLLLATSFHGVLFELPRNIQRTLSFLPGDWDPVSVAEAKDSTDWRVFMWKEALLTDRYIENKVIGDGFGMRKSEFALMNYFAQQGTVEGVRENLMITGSFHSGPVTSIRVVGYMGLVIYLVFLGMLAREAWSLCRAFKGSPYYSLCMLVCLPIILEPFVFVFIFGAFDNSCPDAIYNLGVLKLLRTAAPRPAHAPVAFELTPHAMAHA